MTDKAGLSREVANGDYCVVTGGSHLGKSGIVEDRKLSKTGHTTITVRQDDGVRFKTLAKNAEIRPKP
jgi:ribosomal protein S4E